MNNTVQLVKANGESLNAEIVSFFKLVDTGKKYLFYTLNEQVENNLVKMYVSEVGDSGSLTERMSPEEWLSLKNVMKLILTGNTSDNIVYLKWEG